jgi:hypothetical protein
MLRIFTYMYDKRKNVVNESITEVLTSQFSRQLIPRLVTVKVEFVSMQRPVSMERSHWPINGALQTSWCMVAMGTMADKLGSWVVICYNSLAAFHQRRGYMTLPISCRIERCCIDALQSGTSLLRASKLKTPPLDGRSQKIGHRNVYLTPQLRTPLYSVLRTHGPTPNDHIA